MSQATMETDFAVEPCFWLPPGGTPEAMTSDGHAIGFMETGDGGMRAFWDGEGSAPFDGFVMMRDETRAVFVSGDGAHVAFVAGRDGRQSVVRDGREDPPVDIFSGSVPVVFSAGGVHHAYGGMVDGEVRLIVDGTVVSTLPLAPIQAVWSPSGERLAFVEIRRAADGTFQQRIVLDGQPGPWFFGMRNARGAMQFSPDGRRFAFYRIDGHGRAQWVVDGVAHDLVNDVGPDSPERRRGVGVLDPPLHACFSPDSRHFAYAAAVAGKGAVVVADGVMGPRFEGVGMPVYSPDSRRMAYVALTSSRTACLVVDGKPGPEWTASRASDPVFSADSGHVAMTFMHDAGRLWRKQRLVGCVHDDQVPTVIEGEDVSRFPDLGATGERIAWWVRRGDLCQVMAGRAPHSQEVVLLGEAVHTSSGKLVYAVLGPPDGQATIMVDGWLGPRADLLLWPSTAPGVYETPRTGRPVLSFAVSPDGEHVAWAGVFGDQARPVIDERVGPSFDRIIDWSFDASGTATWWAQRADTVYRVSTPSVSG
jgi:hypothetical protein